MPYGVNTLRLRISFPAAPVSRGYNGRAWKMRPLRGWTGGQAASGEPAVGAEQGGSTVQGVASGSAGAAQQAKAGSSLRGTLDRVIAAMPAKASAAEAQGGGQVVKAASELPAGPVPSADAASGGSGLTAERPGNVPPAAAGAGPPPQPSPAAEEHNRLWWWLHDHGLAHTKHEKADLLRKAMGPGSGAPIVDGNGVPVNVEQLSDDEVIALDKKLRAPPYGLPLVGPANTSNNSHGPLGGDLRSAMEREIRDQFTGGKIVGDIGRPRAIANLDPSLGPNQVRYQVRFADEFGEITDYSVNYDPATGQFGVIKPASGPKNRRR